jgi:hypothetical protein
VSSVTKTTMPTRRNIRDRRVSGFGSMTIG